MKIQTFDNVFDAISDTPEQAENMKIRAQLMTVLNTWIEKQGFNQAEAAAALGVTQPRISELARGKIQMFSVDKLITMMAHAGVYIQNIDIQYPKWWQPDFQKDLINLYIQTDPYTHRRGEIVLIGDWRLEIGATNRSGDRTSIAEKPPCPVIQLDFECYSFTVRQFHIDA